MSSPEGVKSERGSWWETFNPSSPEFKEAEAIFHSENFEWYRKIAVVALSILGAVLFVVGAFPLFRWSVNWLRPEDSKVLGNTNDVEAKRFSSEEVSSKISASEAKSTFSKSAVCQEAIDFSKHILEQNPDVKAHFFKAPWCGDKTLQPVNQDIARLTTLYCDEFWPAFENAILNPDPRDMLAKRNATDNLLKIAYAISTWTLDDLPAFITQLPKDMSKTYAQALTEQDSYQYRTFFFCTRVYHQIRGGLEKGSVREYQNPGVYVEKDGLVYPKEELSKEFVEPFYTKGTFQNSWNHLYNSYCDHVRRVVKEEDLKKADGRHVKWTQKDEKGWFGKINFTSIPDTLPT